MKQKKDELLLFLRQYPEEGICQLIEEYGSAVTTICRHILRGFDQSIVEDVVQESFFRLWKGINNNIIIKKTIKAYLYQTARNCALDYKRSFQRKKEISLEEMQQEKIEEVIIESSVNVEQEFARKHNEKLVHSFISELKEPEKTMVILRFFYGYTIKEIAEQVNLKEDNVESHIRRRRKELQERLLEQGIF